MKKVGQVSIALGLGCLALSLVLPYLAGRLISMDGYNALFFVGIGLAVLGWALRITAKSER